jgi:drug/metabolite transporter (DMT)-like permease
MIAGSLNGIGSLFFYSALERIDAGLGQLLYAMYPVFVAGLLYLDGQRHSKLTLIRIAISLPAIYLLTQAKTLTPDLIGVGFMLTAGLLYALHIPINERVLYEVPPPTVTLYTLAAMTAVVIPANLILSPLPDSIPEAAWLPLLGLTLVTFLSRLTLFTGIRHIGGMQTALLGLFQLLITVVLAQLWLGETLSRLQWIGAVLLILAILMVDREKTIPRTPFVRGWLFWLRPPTPFSEGRMTKEDESGSSKELPSGR